MPRVPAGVSPSRVLIKATAMFLLLETCIVASPISRSAISVYGVFGFQRERFPVSTIPPVDAALDVGDLESMFAAHVISSARAPDEFRVVVLGDSTIWGMQLRADEVLPAQLNRLGLQCNDRRMRFYNLSFPRSSATKDILILDHAMQLEPDAIVWLVTWYTLMPKTRADHWIVSLNPDDFERLGRRFDFLPRDYQQQSFWDKVFNRNRSLFRSTRFQLYSLIQAGTARDQIPGPPQALDVELSADETFEGLKPPVLRSSQISLDLVEDLHDLAAGVPVLLVNEPILIVPGVRNSDVRYNSYYPRWVYDQYRDHLSDAAALHGWHYVDLWNAFSAEYFADTPLHLNPVAHRLLAERLAPEIVKTCP